jgi:hypothetical protein
MTRLTFDPRAASFLAAMLLLAVQSELRAHCDAIDGPVVTAARRALETSAVEHVLIWVRAGDESEIRHAFERTMSVRRLGVEARELADTYFFETVVRVHRAGEGEPYTGLKPAGAGTNAGIMAADRALATGSIDAVTHMLERDLQQKLRASFEAVVTRRAFATADIAAGRHYVEAYVSFIHFVERLYDALHSPSDHSTHTDHVLEHSEHK